MKKNKMLIVASLVFTLGIIMLLGTSYSLINGDITEEGYSFDVLNFNVEFMDNTSISMNGIPVSDEDGLKNSKEFTFTVNNKSNSDVNYKLDIIENSAYPMGDVIKYAYNLNNEGYQNIYTLSDNYTINQNRVLSAGTEDVYKLKIWLSLDADEGYMNKKFSASISLFATPNEYKYAANVIEKLGNSNLDGVKKFDNNYRYVDANSLNYVWFNCMDNYTKGEDYCEKWRIIGSFDNKWKTSSTEYKSLKIMRNEKVELISYNNEELNGNYKSSYIKTFANGAYYDRLNDDSKKLILDSRWYIGNTSSFGYVSAYNEEKLIEDYAKIGLINVSDFLALESNNWLKSEDTILTINKNDGMVNAINNTIVMVDSNEELAFVPVINLKPDVSIISGDGSENNPYELKIRYAMNYGKSN